MYSATEGSVFVLLVYAKFSEGASIDAGVFETKQAITCSLSSAGTTYCRKCINIGNLLQVSKPHML